MTPGPRRTLALSSSLALRGALALLGPLGCGPKGSKVTVLHVEDELAPPPPTVAGAEELAFTTADGVTITGSYWAPAKDTPACAVFVHQLSSNRREYDPVIEKVVGRAHLYAIDLRGHGDSTKAASGTIGWKAFGTSDWQQVEVDLLGALDAVRGRGAGEACVVIGASVGSSAAIRLAGAHPERVRGLVLLSPGLNYRGLATPDAARANRAPVLIVHSQESGAFDAANALAEIFRATPVEVVVLGDPGDAHGMKIVAGSPGMLASVVGFLGDQLW